MGKTVISPRVLNLNENETSIHGWSGGLVLLKVRSQSHCSQLAMILPKPIPNQINLLLGRCPPPLKRKRKINVKTRRKRERGTGESDVESSLERDVFKSKKEKNRKGSTEEIVVQTTTGEFYFPCRLIYRIFDRGEVLKKLRSLNCIDKDPKTRRWCIHCDEEAFEKALKSGV